MLKTGEQDVFGNFAIGLAGDEWQEAARELASQSAPSMLIWPGDRNTDFERVAHDEGFAYFAPVPAMEADLDAVPRVGVPDGYTFERVRASGDGAGWARTLAEGYPVARIAAASMSPLQVVLDDSADAALQYYQVRCGDEIAGVSALALLDGAAGIYCVACLEPHRRKGIGAALTALPLQHAREIGYSVGVLQATEAGFNVYQSLGFHVVGEVQLYSHGMPEL